MSAIGNRWGFRGRLFEGGSRLCEGWLDVTRRAIQAGYRANSRARRWRAFDLKVSSLGIVNPSYKTTITVLDSFVSDNMWFGWSMCPGSGDVFPFGYRRPVATSYLSRSCIRVPLSIKWRSRVARPLDYHYRLPIVGFLLQLPPSSGTMK